MNFQFKSKFNLEEVVWFMENNKPAQGIIHTIHYCRTESVDISCKHKSIFARLKSYLNKTSVKTTVKYELDMVKSDGEFKSATYYYKEDEIFKTKEELLKSL